MDRAMLSKALIQVSVDGWGGVPSLLFDLRPNYGGGNGDDDRLQNDPDNHSGETKNLEPDMLNWEVKWDA